MTSEEKSLYKFGGSEPCGRVDGGSNHERRFGRVSWGRGRVWSAVTRSRGGREVFATLQVFVYFYRVILL